MTLGRAKSLHGPARGHSVDFQQSPGELALMQDHVTAYAPGSVGNVGPGLDILGLAISGVGDEVTLTWRDDLDVVIADAGHQELPSDPAYHSAAIAAAAVLRRTRVARGITLWIRKGLPLSGGQGGSAASAVAGRIIGPKDL